jgi:hypothetical protein
MWQSLRRLLVGAGFVFVVGTLGCGGDDSGSGLDKAKKLTTLTAPERKQLCDWVNQKLGGYGHATECGGGVTLKADSSLEECLTLWSALPALCAATVGDEEACFNHKSCDNPNPVECGPTEACLLGMP